jgi:hypothetical protein
VISAFALGIKHGLGITKQDQFLSCFEKLVARRERHGNLNLYDAMRRSNVSLFVAQVVFTSRG